MQIITVKRLGPGKFYLSNKKQFGFIGGNPSSHKGWMSRYFFVKRISSRENPWDCDMSWRDDACSASLDFIRHLVPNQDFDQLKGTPDLEVFETVGLHFMQSLAWFGEAASRFSKARAEVIKTKRSYDGVLGRHEALLKQLEEIQTKESVEKESLSAELESARAEAQTYKAQAQSLETQVQSLDARAQFAEEESKLRLAEGFEVCLAQFRANGFSEEEYPPPFLDVDQALADMPEDQEEGSSGPGETPPA
ncbi:hypothetical protein F511_07630 [Dorcoceras hygrometricum]|uniref:Uncharacterized protein n=1 Tax=Dorcoceras hygrometricum TaxID=472368 RepID=A0A2Z7CXX8_9LAMI|nr:hypothetical protein F511_07630 [Dorcoceras hygrometricum]